MSGGVASACRAFGVEGRRRRATGGATNDHWFVGDALVLRRYNTLRLDEQIAYEHGMLRHLASRGLPVAAPLPAPDGRTVVIEAERRYALFPRLAGRRRPTAPPRDPRSLGVLLARLHAALVGNRIRALPPPMVMPPAFTIVIDPIWAHLHLVPDPELRRRVRSELDLLAGELGSVDFSSAVTGVVHGDWSEAQLLYRAGVVSAILDFDFVHPDLLVVDLAPLTTTPDVEAAVEFVRGYETERPLTDIELTLLGLAQRARYLQFVWPAVNDLRRGDGSSAVPHIRTQLGHLDDARQQWPALEAVLRAR